MWSFRAEKYNNPDGSIYAMAPQNAVLCQVEVGSEKLVSESQICYNVSFHWCFPDFIKIPKIICVNVTEKWKWNCPGEQRNGVGGEKEKGAGKPCLRRGPYIISRDPLSFHPLLLLPGEGFVEFLELCWGLFSPL